MRIWDVSPGYLNRQSLLGEHRELHGIVSIIGKGMKGYSKHPETLRWAGYGWALQQRHRILVAEMELRGYKDSSPVVTGAREGSWPESYVDEPFRQFRILQAKYRERENGRIPLPENVQELWSHHKYSVLSRDESLYRRIGPEIAGDTGSDFRALARLMIDILRRAPTAGGLRNAIQHMWGHVSDSHPGFSGRTDSWPLADLLREIQERALTREDRYMLSSTALSELMAWITLRKE